MKHLKNTQQFDNNEIFQRSDIIEKVLDIIYTPDENCVIIYGQRGIGKTTLLHCVEKKLSNDKNLICIYFDFSSKMTDSIEQLLIGIADQLSEELKIPHWDINNDILKGFIEEFIPDILEKYYSDHNLVFLFDEFGQLDEDNKSVYYFYQYFNYSQSIFHKRINSVIITGRNPQDIYDIYLSYYKGKKFQRLSLLTKQETFSFIKQIEKNNVVKWPERIIEKIFDLSSGHPLLIRYICKDLREKPYGESPDNSLQKVILDADDFFEKLWDGLDNHCQLLVSIIANCKNDIVSHDEILKSSYDHGLSHTYQKQIEKIDLLIEWDILRQNESGFFILLTMFRIWIVENKPVNLLKKKDNITISISGNLFDAANSLYITGQIDHAMKICMELVKIEPFHVEANILLSDILLDKNELYNSKKILEDLYKKNPKAAHLRFLKVLKLEAATLENLYSYDFTTYNYSIKNNYYLTLCKLRFANIADQENHLLSIYEKILELNPDNIEIIEKYEKLIVRNQNCLRIIKQISYETDVLQSELEAFITTGAKKKIYEIQKKLQFNKQYTNALKSLQKDDIENSKKLLKKVLYLKPNFTEARRFIFIVNNNKTISSVLNNDKKDESLQKDSDFKDKTNKFNNNNMLKDQSLQKDSDFKDKTNKFNNNNMLKKKIIKNETIITDSGNETIKNLDSKNKSSFSKIWILVLILILVIYYFY